MINFGCGMSDSNAHTLLDLLMTVAGGGVGQLKGGRHITYPTPTPLANMNLTLLDKLGIQRIDEIWDSTGRLEGLSDL